VLDYGPLVGRRVPFSDRLVDVIMGEALHEAGHCRWTTVAGGEALAEVVAARALTPAQARRLQAVQNMLEDGYIEEQLRRQFPNLAPYIAALNRHLFPRRHQQALRAQAAAGADFDAWSAALLGFAVLGWRVPRGAAPAVRRQLITFHRIARAVHEEHDVRARVGHAVLLWELLEALAPPSAAEPDAAGGEGGMLRHEHGCTALHDGAAGLPPALARELVALLEGDARDLTAIMTVLDADGRRAPPHATVERQGTADAALLATVHGEASAVAQAIRRSLRLDVRRRPRRLQGETAGRLSTRRPFRIALGQRTVFERRRPGRLDLAIGLLLDASGSTHAIWPTCLASAYALVEALRPTPGIRLEVAAYQGRQDGCQVVRLWDPRTLRLMLGGVAPEGGTPTAEALLAMSHRLRAGAARTRMLIHFTDGRPDDPAAVTRAVALLAQQRIPVATIALGGYRHTASLEQCYGRRYRPITDIVQLPAVLADLAAAAMSGRGG
jgi:hypothetical protein